LAKSSGHQEKVFDLQFSPFADNGLVSCGVKQISFWTLIGNTLSKKKGLFGNTKDIQTMFCLAFSSQKDVIYTGTMNGQVYVWKGNQLEEILPGVHNGSIFTITSMPDGFISGGKDGIIRRWDSTFSPIEIIELKHLLAEYDKSGNFQTDGLQFIKFKNFMCY
jgi:WD40 repeat protein